MSFTDYKILLWYKKERYQISSQNQLYNDGSDFSTGTGSLTYSHQIGQTSQQNGVKGGGPKNKLKIIESSAHVQVANRLENNVNLSNKMSLFLNLQKLFDFRGQNPFDFVPRTYIIQAGLGDQILQDPEYMRFLEYFNQKQEQVTNQALLAQNKLHLKTKPGIELPQKQHKLHNIWIIKPGEFSNRGNGISLCKSLDNIEQKLQESRVLKSGKKGSYILQEYIDKPFLYKKRKFDIRCFMLITSINGKLKGYWYRDGYIRTSSSKFVLGQLDNRFVHLTNDAVQKHGKQYGKFEKGNKLNFKEFQDYLDSLERDLIGLQLSDEGESNIFDEQPPDPPAQQLIQEPLIKRYDFLNKSLPQMKQLARYAIQSVYKKIDPLKRQHCFEVLIFSLQTSFQPHFSKLYGLDFMIDSNFKPWLIEINTNPCLETTCMILKQLIPKLLDDTLKIALDPIFPPPYPISQFKNYVLEANYFKNNQYELIFDETEDKDQLKGLFSFNAKN